MNVLYLIGPPASGKSTLMAHLTQEAARTPNPNHPIPHDHLTYPDTTTAAELGTHRPHFPGTDTLSMSINPTATASLTNGTWNSHDHLLAEGDRLANTQFLLTAHTHHQLTVLYLHAPPHLTRERAHKRGSKQSETWTRGRATKAERLAALLDAHGVNVHELPAHHPPHHIAEQARSLSHLPAPEQNKEGPRT